MRLEDQHTHGPYAPLAAHRHCNLIGWKCIGCGRVTHDEPPAVCLRCGPSVFTGLWRRGPLTLPERRARLLRIARRATSNTAGRTVRNIARIGDRRWVIWMSSWVTADDAIQGFKELGYDADHVGSIHVAVTEKEEQR